MMYHSLKLEPLAAFLLTALVALGHVCLIFPLLGLLHVPQALGHVMSVWFPSLLSALVYVLLTARASTGKLKSYSRTLAAAVLAPAAAWAVNFFFCRFFFLRLADVIATESGQKPPPKQYEIRYQYFL